MLRDWRSRREAPPHPRWRAPVLTIGGHTYGRPHVVGYTGHQGEARIGRYCSVSQDVTFLTGERHHLDWVSTFPMREMLDLPGAFEDHPFDAGPIHVGHDVWLGRGCTIVSGVTVGHGAVVAANALVVKDVAPYEIVGGNPARHIRLRFDEDEIAALLEIAWWDWPHEDVLAAVDLLNGAGVGEFIARHRPARAADAH